MRSYDVGLDGSRRRLPERHCDQKRRPRRARQLSGRLEVIRTNATMIPIRVTQTITARTSMLPPLELTQDVYSSPGEGLATSR